MARSIKKGPFCDDHLMKKVEEQKGSKDKKSHSDLVAQINHFPCIYRVDHCRV